MTLLVQPQVCGASGSARREAVSSLPPAAWKETFLTFLSMAYRYRGFALDLRAPDGTGCNVFHL